MGVKGLSNKFHVAVRLFSDRSKMTSNCGKNKRVAYKAQLSVSLIFREGETQLPAENTWSAGNLQRKIQHFFILARRHVSAREKFLPLLLPQYQIAPDYRFVLSMLVKWQVRDLYLADDLTRWKRKDMTLRCNMERCTVTQERVTHQNIAWRNVKFSATQSNIT